MIDPLLRRSGAMVTLHLDQGQRAALAAAFAQLRDLLVNGGDPNLARLFPGAYPDDRERDEEYHRLVGDDLLAAKLEAIDVVETTLESGVLHDDEAFFAWMGSLNDLRLVLGTRLDVTDDIEQEPEDPDDAMAWAVYQFLGYLLECTVEIAPL